jgi:hypothetical protein
MSNSIVSSHRRVSLTAGILYLLTFVSLPTLALYNSVKGVNYEAYSKDSLKKYRPMAARNDVRYVASGLR